MKKTLIALAAVAATGAAMAQSSVTLYGVVDVNFGKTKKSTAGVTNSDATGLREGATGGLSGSRLGVKGSEDLGGGMKAGFAIETGVTADQLAGVTANPLGNRQSFVSLGGGFGTVALGRQYVPTFGLTVATDADGMSAFSTSSPKSAAGPVRGDNAISYTSPNWSGFSFGAALVKDSSGVAPSISKVSGYDLAATYAAGPLMVGAGLSSATTDTPAGVPTWCLPAGSTAVTTSACTAAQLGAGAATLSGAAQPASSTKGTSAIIGGTYDFGFMKMYANYIAGSPALNGGAKKKLSDINLGVTAPFGPFSVVAGVGLDRNTTTAGVKERATDFVLGANYAFSKRSDAYIRFGRDKDAVASGATGATTSSYAVGLRHTF